MGTRREGRDQNVIINHRYTQFNNSIPVAVASPGFFFRWEGGRGRVGEGAPFKTVSIINSDSYPRFVLELLPSSCTVLRYNVFLAKHTYGVAEPKLAV